MRRCRTQERERTPRAQPCILSLSLSLTHTHTLCLHLPVLPLSPSFSRTRTQTHTRSHVHAGMCTQITRTRTHTSTLSPPHIRTQTHTIRNFSRAISLSHTRSQHTHACAHTCTHDAGRASTPRRPGTRRALTRAWGGVASTRRERERNNFTLATPQIITWMKSMGHAPRWPDRVCVCVCVCVSMNVCVCVCVCVRKCV